VRALQVVNVAERAAFGLARAGIPPNSLWIADLRGAASVAFGATLSRYASVAPVLTFNNWPAEQALVPAEETLAALLVFTPELPQGSAPATPVFLLDTWRLAYADQTIDDATDNRYLLGPHDFPSAEQLSSLGIHQVVYLVENRHATNMERDDLHAIFSEWADAGIELSIIDLGDLLGEQPVEPCIVEHRYIPRFRHTIVEGDYFHVHSPGGFGGYEGPRSPAFRRWYSGSGG